MNAYIKELKDLRIVFAKSEIKNSKLMNEIELVKKQNNHLRCQIINVRTAYAAVAGKPYDLRIGGNRKNVSCAALNE